jgi:predicted unusual protein kinase regulating ubiquinone biosynthesis (AarF/ABC1/UbiB family)
MADIRRGRVARATKFASLPAGIAGRAALGVGKRWTGKSREDVNAELVEKAAEQLFEVLGELKGAAMKLGQALSVMEAAIPPELAEPFREALTKLQADAPPLPAEKVHRVLDAQLGTKWRQRFQSFDDKPVAAASIGQVHKAVWNDGRVVAVKVQYPGADEAVRADLRTMKRLASVFKPLAPNVNIGGLIDELIDRTEAELDYRSEANYQRAFAKAFAGDPKVFIPSVVASSPKIVVSEWMEGRRLAEIITNGTKEDRDLVCSLMLEFTVSAPYRAQLMHGDPHPGNFMLLPDGRLGVLDFGAVDEFPQGLPADVGPILHASYNGDYDHLFALLRSNGFIVTGSELELDPDEVNHVLAPYVDPLKPDYFHFTREWLQETTAQAADLSGPQAKFAFQISRHVSVPPGYVMLFRVLGGLVGIAAQLDATVPYGEIVERWIPGFQKDIPTVAVT